MRFFLFPFLLFLRSSWYLFLAYQTFYVLFLVCSRSSFTARTWPLSLSITIFPSSAPPPPPLDLSSQPSCPGSPRLPHSISPAMACSFPQALLSPAREPLSEDSAFDGTLCSSTPVALLINPNNPRSYLDLHVATGTLGSDARGPWLIIGRGRQPLGKVTNRCKRLTKLHLGGSGR